MISRRCARGARARHDRPRSAGYASSRRGSALEPGHRHSPTSTDSRRVREKERTSISGRACGNGESRGRSEGQSRLPQGDTVPTLRGLEQKFQAFLSKKCTLCLLGALNAVALILNLSQPSKALVRAVDCLNWVMPALFNASW